MPAIADYLSSGAWELVGEFTEVESGKKIRAALKKSGRWRGSPEKWMTLKLRKSCLGYPVITSGWLRIAAVRQLPSLL